MTSVAAGTVVAFSGTAAKLARLADAGWLTCQGGTVSRNTYPLLFSAIGTTYGGDGNPNFVLPDLRGYFLRGVDEGTGRDPDRAARYRPGGTTTGGDSVGSWQNDQIKSHQHNWDHFFRLISASGGDIAVHQPPNSPNLQNNSAHATNDEGGNESRPKNVYVYFLIATGANT